MTEYDAIEIIKYYFPKKKVLDCGIFVEVNDRDSALGCALEEAVSALYEIKQYREIGTVEECRDAAEKQEAKNIIRIAGRYPYKCPTCNGKLEIGYKHCIVCGQLLRYPYKNLEGMEDV